MLKVSDFRLTADDDATFEHSFPAGEISVVLGANQSGKTDLCRLIAGLNTRARGRVSLNGRDLEGLPPRQRPISLVYQAFVNYPNLSVFDNIASPLKARKVAPRELAKKVAELAAALRIEELLERMPHELSGGQQQRVAIARALAKQADVLLLDEPLVNLDFKLREALETELRELLSATDTVVIYTSSDPRDAFALGDQLVLLGKAKKLQAGTPMDVYRNPGCIAAMELLADPGVNRFYRHGRLCALRPEHIGPTASLSLDTDSVDFQMRVTAYDTNGDESFVHGLVENEEWVLRSRGMLPVIIGQVLPISAAAQDVVAF